MPMPKHGKSILMTPDPYHTPGYGGFCPQFKFQIGETFGRTTSRLLKDPKVVSSGQLVLADNRFGGPHTSLGEPNINYGEKVSLIKRRTQNYGSQKLKETMVPGYTGFIPKSQHYFGKRYAENCLNSIVDFEQDQIKRRDARSSVSMGGEGGPMGGSHQPHPPLQAKAKEAKPYISVDAHHHSMSPYYMNNNNPKKSFMSGYTGFVPRARGLIGKSYPLITHQALNDFSTDLTKFNMLTREPVRIQRQQSQKMDHSQIYPVFSGMVPHYTGHIPGQKFRYGNTFGNSTENALSSTAVGLSAAQACA
ncbi:ciliary microtubule inner protein 2B-like [Lineus longissimus]|uniref:ciliary microtubule inner protein 2B-like n=1 Tax=Lineus longissimus TaxID=88925 RepID=UPI002B4CD079